MTDAIESQIAEAWTVIERRYRRTFGDLSQDIAQESALGTWQYMAKQESGDASRVMGQLAGWIARKMFDRSPWTLDFARRSALRLDTPGVILRTRAGFDSQLELSDFADKLLGALTAYEADAIRRWMDGERLYSEYERCMGLRRRRGIIKCQERLGLREHKKRGGH